LEEREDVVLDDLVHLVGRHVLQTIPAQVRVWSPGRLPLGGEGAIREDRPLDRGTRAVRLPLGSGLRLVKGLDEQQERQLLHHFERVGDAA
jgi:hypothetical protein